MPNFRRSISAIRPGEPVSANVTNRPLFELLRNDLALRELINLLQEGRAVIDSSVSLAPDVQEGQAVYYRSQLHRYERALAAVEHDPQTGRITWAESAYVQGLVIKKLNPTLGHVLLAGVSTVDLSAAIDGPILPGAYFLSAHMPGKLTRERPPAGVLVCQIGMTESGTRHRVHISPRLQDLLHTHEHLVFDLVCRPAGSHVPPLPGERHVIEDPDPTLEGWLPANHEIFEGRAPSNAAFGYNLSVSPLSGWWPPVPLQSAQLEWHRGQLQGELGQMVPLGPEGLCQIDLNGIWWLSDCYGDVPWPTDWDTSSVSEISDSPFVECPRNLFMTLRLGFSRMLFQTVNSAVLSLKTDPNSGLELVCRPSGAPGETGHLLLRRNESLRIDPNQSETGFRALKRISSEGIFHFGPVLEGLSISGPNVFVTSTGPTVDGFRTGRIQITLTNTVDGLEIPISELRLDGVSTQYFQDVPTLMFPAGTSVSLRGSVIIPQQLNIPSQAEFRLNFWGLSRQSGAVPPDLLVLTYRRIPRPTAERSPVNLPAVDTPLILPMNATLSNADQYYRFSSHPISLAAGDLLLFSLTRNPSSGYTADFHLLRQSLILSLGGA